MSRPMPAQNAPVWLHIIRMWVNAVLRWPVRFAGRLRRRRVPVIIQARVTECGAACLAMILNYYGRQIRVDECYEALGIGRDGVTTRTLARAARDYGLRVRAFSIEPAQLRYIQLPAIAHWNFDHFVVVERWSPTTVEIVNPIEGRRKLTAEEFSAGFTGVVLTLEPGDAFERRQLARVSPWRTYVQRIVHMPGAAGILAQILGASLVLQIIGLALPIFTKIVVDQVLPFHITNVMVILGIGMAAVVLSQLITSYLRAALLIYLQARLDMHMMLGFFDHLLRLPFRFFHGRRIGDLTSRLWSNLIIRDTLTNQTLSAILDGTLVLVYLIILLAQSPSFGGLVLCVGILQLIIPLVTARRMQSLTQRSLAAQSESQSYLVEALRGMMILKASGSEDRALDRWSNLFFTHLNIMLQRSHLSAIVDTAMTTIRTFAPLLLLWVGTLRVLEGSLSLGTMLALNALAAAFLQPLTSLLATGQQLHQVSAHLERTSDVLEAMPEQANQGIQPAPALSGRIEVKNVSFRYSANAPLVLHDISFTIEPGQKVALVGPSGSGKSTLALLLLGLYTPTTGEIFYDGIPLRRLNYRTLRSQFGVVLQEPFLFSNSIRQNIALREPACSLEEIMAAAQVAAVHDDITRMPMGYDTFLAEGGAGLSGGQRQRLELARAIVNRPAVLLLDEATSHLDAVTEQQVEQNLNRLACTRIVIAHRLSTVRDADLILVFDQGTIVERGTHAELLARRGFYASLVRAQGAAAPAQLAGDPYKTVQLSRLRSDMYKTAELHCVGGGGTEHE